MSERRPTTPLRAFAYCDFAELPSDADPTVRGGRWSYGSDVFGGSGHWVIVENGTSPIKVYRVPMPVSRLLNSMFDARFAAGQDHARAAMRTALGL